MDITEPSEDNLRELVKENGGVTAIVSKCKKFDIKESYTDDYGNIIELSN